MTCIIGLATNDGDVYIGGDSAASGNDGQSIMRLAHPEVKVFRNGEFLIGCAGSFRNMQLMRYKFNPPKQDDEVDELEYMATTFVDALRDSLIDGGAATVKNGQEEAGYSVFLVGYRGRLFCVYSDYAVEEVLGGIDATGCGREYAIGAMAALKLLLIPPKERILKALEISAEYSKGVRPPFKVEKL